jgi:hypothetical protein
MVSWLHEQGERAFVPECSETHCESHPNHPIQIELGEDLGDHVGLSFFFPPRMLVDFEFPTRGKAQIGTTTKHSIMLGFKLFHSHVRQSVAFVGCIVTTRVFKYFDAITSLEFDFSLFVCHQTIVWFLKVKIFLSDFAWAEFVNVFPASQLFLLIDTDRTVNHSGLIKIKISRR